MGAIALAADLEPDVWMGVREMLDGQITGELALLVDAARHLCRAAIPYTDPDAPVDDLVGVLGDWQDTASDADVANALTKAAHMAEGGK